MSPDPILEASRYFTNKRFESWLGYEDIKGRGYNFSVIQLLNPQKGEFILDDGSGNGRFSLAMADTGARIVSLDVNKFMVQAVKRGAADKGLKKRIDVVIADCQNLPFRDELFNKILCIHNMWYVPLYEKAVNEMFRTAKAGGKIVVDQISEKWRTQHIRIYLRFLLRYAIFIQHALSRIKRQQKSYEEMPIFLRTPEQFLRPFVQYPTRFYNIPLPSLLYEILNVTSLPHVFQRVKGKLWPFLLTEGFNQSAHRWLAISEKERSYRENNKLKVE